MRNSAHCILKMFYCNNRWFGLKCIKFTFLCMFTMWSKLTNVFFFPQHGDLYSHLGLWPAPTWSGPQDPGPLRPGLCLGRVPDHTVWLPPGVHPVSGGDSPRGVRALVFTSLFYLHQPSDPLTCGCVYRLFADEPSGPEPSVPRSRCWQLWASTRQARSRRPWETR